MVLLVSSKRTGVDVFCGMIVSSGAGLETLLLDDAEYVETQEEEEFLRTRPPPPLRQLRFRAVREEEVLAFTTVL